MATDMESSASSGTEQFEQTGFLTKTANGAGWQINALDPYGEIFVEYAKTTRRPIADLGVAFGYTSKCMLDAGAQVIANDLSTEMLEELETSVTKEQKSRLTIMPGDALHLDIAEKSLDGVWANRFLHFLKPEDIRRALKLFSSWLAPGGKLCITVASPYFAQAADFLPEYEKRKAAGAEWPGFMTGEEMPQAWRDASDFKDCGNLLDTDILQREVQKAGLKVEKCSYIPRPYASTNGKEGVGIIAVKEK